MPKPQQGRIIVAELPDPQGRNPKPRPLVIVSSNEEIDPEEPFWCVAITGTLPQKLPEDCVLLPYHPKGHPRTGLKKRCAAMASWLVEVRAEQITRFLGVVPATELEAILRQIDNLEPPSAENAD